MHQEEGERSGNEGSKCEPGLKVICIGTSTALPKPQFLLAVSWLQARTYSPLSITFCRTKYRELLLSSWDKIRGPPVLCSSVIPGWVDPPWTAERCTAFHRGHNLPDAPARQGHPTAQSEHWPQVFLWPVDELEKGDAPGARRKSPGGCHGTTLLVWWQESQDTTWSAQGPPLPFWKPQDLPIFMVKFSPRSTSSTQVSLSGNSQHREDAIVLMGVASCHCPGDLVSQKWWNHVGGI